MIELIHRSRRWLAARRARARWASVLAGATASAILYSLCGRMEAPLFALSFVGLIPWLFGLERARTWRQAALAGAIMSAAFVVWVFPWFPEAAQRYSGSPSIVLWLIMIAAAPLIEPQFIVYAVVRHLMRRDRGRLAALLGALAGAFAYAGAELALPKLFFDTLGMALHPSLYLRQAADLAGVHGLTILVILVNESAFLAIRRLLPPAPSGGLSASNDDPGSAASSTLLQRLKGPALPAFGAAAALLAATFIYGGLRLAAVEARSRAPGRSIGFVQANITNYDRLRAEKGAFETVRMVLDTHYDLSDQILARGKADVIVWPETVYPTTLGSPKSEAGEAFDKEILDFARDRGIPLVLGAYDTDGEREFNAAFFLSPRKAEPPSITSYRKRMLFPLTEWVPPAIDSEELRAWLPWAGRWHRGPGPKVIPLDLPGGERASVLPLLCYDVLFPDFVADAAALGADIIITLSNDSWFPDERAPRLHLISAAFRSIETRLPQVRATNSGISAVISPSGAISSETRWARREAVSATVPAIERMVTPAVAARRWIMPALLGAALLLVGRALVRARSLPENKDGEGRANDPRRRQRRSRTAKTTGTRIK